MEIRSAQTITVHIAIGLALWLGIALQPSRSEDANEICGADAKAANLNLTLKDIKGKTITLSDYQGKVVLLDFWATWCPPCKKEIPGFIELFNAYKSRGLVVIGVSMDESISDVKRFASQIGMNYPILMGAGRDDELGHAFGPLPLPTAFVIGRDGRICAKHDGFTAKEQIEREIVSLF